VATYDWVFVQLGGSRKQLVMGGSTAPHGRAHHGAMAENKVTARKTEHRYPGRTGVTRNVFGTGNEPVTLKGRFSDSKLGATGAAARKAAELEQFCADLQPIRVSWGPSVVWEGFISSVTIGRESSGEHTWELECEVDVRVDTKTVVVKAGKPPADYTAKILGYFDAITPPKSLTFKASILDRLSEAVSAILSPLRALKDLADQLAALKTATLGEIRRFVAGLSILRDSLMSFRDTFASLPADVALEVAGVKDAVTFASWQASMDEAILAALGTIAEADRAASRAQISQIRGVITAQPGDTWESLSSQAFGDPSRAADIQRANDVERPVAGTDYIIPR